MTDNGTLQDLGMMVRFYHQKAKDALREQMALMVTIGGHCKAGKPSQMSPRLQQASIGVYDRFFDYDQFDESTWDHLFDQELEVHYQAHRANDPQVPKPKRWRARRLLTTNVMFEFAVMAELCGKEFPNETD